MTDGELETLREEMDEQRDEIRAALAEEFGGTPEDSDSTPSHAADGGE